MIMIMGAFQAKLSHSLIYLNSYHFERFMGKCMMSLFKQKKTNHFAFFSFVFFLVHIYRAKVSNRGN